MVVGIDCAWLEYSPGPDYGEVPGKINTLKNLAALLILQV
jgi:hypothetical protein